MTTHSAKQSVNGFTMVELIIVVLIVSILAVVGLPRMFDSQALAARGFFDASQALVRYGQKLAIAQRRMVYVNLSGAGNTLCLSYDAADAQCSNPATLVRDPQDATSRFQLAVPGGVHVAGAATSDSAFGFNGLGQPVPDRVHTLSVQGDGATRTITIERETGYVH